MNKIYLAVVIFLMLVGGYYYFLNHRPVTSTAKSNVSMQSANTVTITADGFSPQEISIKAGESVTWINKSGAAVSINSNPHPLHTDYPPLNLGIVDNNGSVSLVFGAAGTYGYHNHLNPAEKGAVVVK